MIITSEPFCIRFSGITICFVPKAPVGIPPEFEALSCAADACADVTYEICPLNQPLTFSCAPVWDNQGTLIYETLEGQWRVYSLRKAANGAQVACLLRKDGINRIFYPKELWEHYTRPLHCSHLMGIENVLLESDGFLLHSSVVAYKGKAVLFAGPSGVGKSTQSQLWKQVLGADILNGDRCVVRECDGVFYGGGSPCAGHSLIYREESAPIAGVVLLDKAPDNVLCQMGASAVPQIFSQILINSWDTRFMNRITDLLQRFLHQVPVYHFRCYPDSEAVELVRSTLFGTI